MPIDILQQDGGDTKLEGIVRLVRGDHFTEMTKICEHLLTGVISIADLEETAKLTTLVKDSTKFIRTLPWAVPRENNGKGPFDNNELRSPDFSIAHGG